jgi:hypothetical protein
MIEQWPKQPLLVEGVGSVSALDWWVRSSQGKRKGWPEREDVILADSRRQEKNCSETGGYGSHHTATCTPALASCHLCFFFLRCISASPNLPLASVPEHWNQSEEREWEVPDSAGRDRGERHGRRWRGGPDEFQGGGEAGSSH